MPIRPSMPGSGTAVPPELLPVEVDEVAPPEVEEVVVPPEVVPPEVEEVVVPPEVVPPEVDDVVDEVVELEVEELPLFGPPLLPGAHHEKPRACTGLATATASSRLVMARTRFIHHPL